jgi:hypothetical protein
MGLTGTSVNIAMYKFYCFEYLGLGKVMYGLPAKCKYADSKSSTYPGIPGT